MNDQNHTHPRPYTRRVVLKAGGAIAFTVLLPLPLTGCGSGGRGGSATGFVPGGVRPPTQAVSFLDASQLDTLRAVVDRFIPGQPEDLDPGAVAANCAEAISFFLGAFLVDPPFIYAGGPFSDRNGEPDNDFLRFIPLDPYEEMAWRLQIEGSQGRPELEFNGPVIGAQEVYTSGLARLNERAGGNFAAAPAVQRDAILADTSDAAVQALVDIAYPDTLEAMYGPPEYGGNEGLVGWENNNFDGDVQPRGYTDDEVINADNPGLLDALLPPSFSEGGIGRPAPRPLGLPSTGTNTVLLNRKVSSGSASNTGLPAILSGETVAAAMAAANGSMAAFRSQLAPLLANYRSNNHA